MCPLVENDMSLYKELVAANVPISNHYSDLYFLANDTARAVLKQFPDVRPSMFVNQLDGKVWFDVFGMYEPYWACLDSR